MHAPTPARGTARFWIVTLALTLAAAPVSAQCVITGPSALCNGSAQLCGPTGNYSYTWNGPNGMLETTQCVTATVPGDYMLSVINLDAFQFSMCSKTVGAGSSPPTAVIEGPASACTGESVTLCGADVGFGFLWTGPSGTATTQCVTASAGETWTLSLVDVASGCTGASATQTVESELCSAFSACPRPPVFWARGCRRPEKFRYSTEQMASIAACVGEQSALFAWDAPLAGVCDVLNPSSPTLRDRARRQIAGLRMNICAWESRQVPSRGAPVGLDPSATFASETGSSSVGSWLATAESRMLALEGQSQDKKAVREAYRSVIQQAWKLNHAEGLDSPCRSTAPTGDPARLVPFGDDADVDVPLEVEMMWELERNGVAIDRPFPNPMSDRTAISFTVGGTSPQRVTVTVHDLAGRRVAELISGLLTPGQHTASWNGRGDDGQMARPGMYFVRARGDVSETRTTLTLVR